MSTEPKQHPFLELSDLIDKYKKNKDSFDVKELQTMREDIALCVFYLSDSASQAIANADSADYNRKRNYAEQIEANKYDTNGNKNTVSTAESLARVANKDFEEKLTLALRQKERVKIILNSTNQILNALSSRINMTKQ